MITKWSSFKYYLPAVFWAMLLFCLSSIPSNSLPSIDIEYFDLFLHFSFYSVFGYFLGIACVGSGNSLSKKVVTLAMFIGVLYGASDEFHQLFVTGRQAAVSDFIADRLGVMFGLYIFLKFPRIFKVID